MKMIISLLTPLASMFAFGEYREGSLAPEGLSDMPEVVYHAYGDAPEDDDPDTEQTNLGKQPFSRARERGKALS